MLSRTSRTLQNNGSLSHTTLLPFLYGTRTIQCIRSISGQSRSGGGGYIPWNKDPSSEAPPDNDTNRSPPSLSPDSDETTTMTPTERKAFRSLFKLSPAKKRKQPSTPTTTDHTSDPTTSADSPRTRIPRPPREFPAPLREMAEKRARARARTAAPPPKPTDANQSAELRRAIQADLARVAALTDAARTDVEVWRVLDAEVLARVRALDLHEREGDAEAAIDASKAKRRARRTDAAGSTKRIVEEAETGGEAFVDGDVLAVTLERHVHRIQRRLATRFPGSVLARAVLHALRKSGGMGMGASTQLFNTQLWVVAGGGGKSGGGERNPAAGEEIAALLAEMDGPGGVGFDEGTAAIVRGWVADVRAAGRGERGEAARLVVGTQRMKRSLAGVVGWMERVAKRREEDAIRAVREWEDEQGMAQAAAEESQQDEDAQNSAQAAN